MADQLEEAGGITTSEDGTLRVLIIDDEECIRDSLAIYLNDLGIDVFVAENPSQCNVFTKKSCEHEHPCADLMLIDHNMPEVLGLEFIRKQSESRCKLLPENRVVMSGTVTPEMLAEAKKLGCMLVQKPFSFTLLDSILEEARQRLSPHRVLVDIPEEHKFRF